MSCFKSCREETEREAFLHQRWQVRCHIWTVWKWCGLSETSSLRRPFSHLARLCLFFVPYLALFSCCHISFFSLGKLTLSFFCKASHEPRSVAFGLCQVCWATMSCRTQQPSPDRLTEVDDPNARGPAASHRNGFKTQYIMPQPYIARLEKPMSEEDGFSEQYQA